MVTNMKKRILISVLLLSLLFGILFCGIFLLRKNANEKEKIKAVDLKSKEQEINEFKYEISVWQKLTNFDKDLGKYYTYEIISPSSKMKGFEYCETVSTSQFFVKNENKMYYSAEELIFDKFNGV